MEINEAIIIFIVGLVFGFISAKWLINWAIEKTVSKIVENSKNNSSLDVTNIKGIS